MTITKSNIKEFIGMTVDCSRRLHHYYPLTIKKRDEQYFYVDATDTWIWFDDRDVIYYDTICKPEQEEK